MIKINDSKKNMLSLSACVIVRLMIKCDLFDLEKTNLFGGKGASTHTP